MKNLNLLVHSFFARYGEETPNPCLVREIIRKQRIENPEFDNSQFLTEIVGKLRKYGYRIPEEERADIDDLNLARPFLIKFHGTFRRLREGD